MNLTWHIIKKDLRALRWPLLLWLLVVVAKLGVGLMLLTASGTEGAGWFTRMDGMAKLFACLEYSSFILVAAIVHEDLLVGTTAFWMTRPISGGRLLRAKLLGIALVFGLAPVIVTLPWWLFCGYGAREMVWAAVETIFCQAIAVLLGLLWAVVTDGFARFLMWILVTVFAIPALGAMIGVYVHRAGAVVPTTDVFLTRAAVVGLVGALASVAVLLHQFLTRRTPRSIGLIVVAAGLALAVGLWWPWSWSLESRLNGLRQGQNEALWPVSPEPAGLTFTPGPAKLLPRANNGRVNAWNTVRFDVTVGGLRARQNLDATAATGPGWESRATWRWPDGSVDSFPCYVFRGDWKNVVTRQTLDALAPPASGGAATEMISFDALVSSEAAKRLLDQAPAFSANLSLVLAQIPPAEILPLRPGVRTLRGVVGERMAVAEKEGEELQVKFVRHYPGLFVDGWLGGLMPPPELSLYMLVNHARSFVDHGRNLDGLQTRVGTVVIAWQTVVYVASAKAGGPRPLLEAINALNDADLVKVSYTGQQRFLHEFSVDHLAVETSGTTTLP